MRFIAFRGAVFYETQIGRLFLKFPRPRFLMLGVKPIVGWDRT